MQPEQTKSRRTWLLTVAAALLLLGVMGILWWIFAPDELTPAEEHAKKFVEAAYIHKDPDRVRPLVDPELVEPGAFTGKGFPPGEVLIGSFTVGVNHKVVVILPEHYGRHAYLEINMIPKGEGWVITSEKKYPGKPSFEEIQQQPEYQRWGIEEWKSAETY